MLEEQILDTKLHDRKAFRCGEPQLDHFLNNLAGQLAKKNITNTYVLVEPNNPTEIVGFYSLSAAQVDHSQFNQGLQKKLPKYPIPCFRLGRLARSQKHKGQDIGELLIGKAVIRCLKAKEFVAAFALIVEAKNEKARNFYIKYGFISFDDDDHHLFLIL
ncbi:GNAT family N-acetyltransferase [Polynucleobacter rarus]|uniref:GNAT family N-acetyltransferase n=1 Tax=Polynucleobacter rarus TaxID=556055 RepID=UPI000D3E7836|nr:GNAT family N-acetyltransferase [Polynucleobacter rarus]